MSIVVSSFTVLFSEPFWIGVFERYEGERYEVAKVVFGAEPKDNEVYEKLLAGWGRLKFSPSLKAEKQTEVKINPKRMQRLVHTKVEQKYLGTKAQQALKLQQEENKTQRKEKSRARKEQILQKKFDLKQDKKREKHKGH